MNNKLLTLSIALLLFIIIFSGCINQKEIESNGKVVYVDLEGGFYGIVADNGQKYKPVNLDEEFKEDGLFIHFKARAAQNQTNIHMWGKLIYILEIEKFEKVGHLVDYIGCKNDTNTFETPTDKDCIKYSYENNVLSLTHVNAGFNCCPEIAANIWLNDDKIIIEEYELEALCHCLCLFDLEYEIANLGLGIYDISIIEPYIHKDEEKLEFTMDLINTNSGEYCVDRHYYPWE